MIIFSIGQPITQSSINFNIPDCRFVEWMPSCFTGRDRQQTLHFFTLTILLVEWRSCGRHCEVSPQTGKFFENYLLAYLLKPFKNGAMHYVHKTGYHPKHITLLKSFNSVSPSVTNHKRRTCGRILNLPQLHKIFYHFTNYLCSVPTFHSFKIQEQLL